MGSFPDIALNRHLVHPPHLPLTISSYPHQMHSITMYPAILDGQNVDFVKWLLTHLNVYLRSLTMISTVNSPDIYPPASADGFHGPPRHCLQLSEGQHRLKPQPVVQLAIAHPVGADNLGDVLLG